MDIGKAQEFLRTNHRAIFYTRRSDGSPQLSPVACALDGSGAVVVSTRETAVKARNVARDPNVSLCVFGDGFFGQWIQVDGTAEVVHLPEALDGLVAYYRAVSGEHPDWDEYRAAMEREKRVLLRITIDRAGPDVSG
ncbi:MAG TPA: PPOX class F420-dependent oxidoreductase [Acidimicrobiales bacterium]|jgi:PPOX class probable F420-dependent enzyme|nr:PPOX class F420-dependent oxidoreductase [Acidimicrobiales bacterium]